MSSTQLKAVRWGWRTFTIDTGTISEYSPITTQARAMPLWLSVSLAFGLVVASAFFLNILYLTAITFNETATIQQLVISI